MTSKVLFIISEMMVMLPVTLMEARLGREVMALKILSLSELVAEDTLYFKNTLMGKAGLKNVLVWSDFYQKLWFSQRLVLSNWSAFCFTEVLREVI